MKKPPGLVLWLALTAALLAACGSRPVSKAPVEDRGNARNQPPRAAQAPAPAQVPAQAPVPAQPLPETAKPLRGQDSAGKPGFYTVQRGDTLIRIALDNGQNWRDIVRWNNLDNPNLIEVGDVLRVLPPPGEGVVARPIAPYGANPAPLPASGRPIAGQPGQPGQPGSAAPSTGLPQAGPSNATATAQPANAPAAGDELSWIWPSRGNTLASFDEVKNKGVDIAGQAGDPVLAAADGRVVYAGSGLRGYGNLIILKHNNTYLTAYAHNQTLLVKEDQAVKQGQKIAEMGSTDADRVKLHFEIRRQGKPVDPAKYLPPR